MKKIVALALPVLLVACGDTGNVKLPGNTPVTVYKYRDFPAWATRPYQKPVPADGTVGARTISHEERGELIDKLLCHRYLLTLLEKGEEVAEETCDKK